jgi:DNA replication protein DnaC
MRTVMARFPYHQTLESFDVSFQPSVDRKKLQELATCRFIEHGDNVVFLGPPGTGNTHVAIGLGLKAVQQGYRTLFSAALPRIAALTKAYAENLLEERLKQDCVPTLLIIDEIGYIPLARHGAHLCFQLISRRDERGAMILTS